MRSLEELKELVKPALDYTELIDIARTASSNTQAKDRALEFTREQGLDEQVAMSCRWLKMLRDQLDQEEFEQFVLSYTNKEGCEMVSRTILSKTEQYNLQLNALCNCADPKIALRAKAAKDLGFDPTRIEEVLGISLENVAAPEPVCAHCPRVDNFSLHFTLRNESSRLGVLLFVPMGQNGFSLSIDIDDLCFAFSKEFWVDKIDVKEDSVVFKTHTFAGYGYDGAPVRFALEVAIGSSYISSEGEGRCIIFRCETDRAESWVARERSLLSLNPISR